MSSPGTKTLQCREQPQGRRLARTIGSKEAEDLTATNGQVHAADGLDGRLAALEGLSQVSCLDDRRLAHHSHHLLTLLLSTRILWITCAVHHAGALSAQCR
jgi:hypothetical protein